MKRFALLLVCLLVTAIFLSTANVFAQQDPPTGVGDWNVFSTTYLNDTTVVLDGDLNIQAGGHLYLSNCVIYFNCTYDNEFRLYINSDGTLHLNNGTILTGPKNQSLNYYWTFYQYWGDMWINNSVIEQAGTPSTYTGLYLRDDADIQNTTFQNCAYGLYCVDWGVEDLYMKNVLITNITGVDPAYGMYVDYTTATFENVTIDGVTTTGTSTPTTYGFYFQDLVQSTLSGFTVKNIYSDYYSYGIYINSGLTTVENIQISGISSDYYAYGLYSYWASSYYQFLTFTDITATDRAYGLYIYDSSTSVNNCTFTDIFGDYAYGLYTKSYTLSNVVDVEFSQIDSTYRTYGAYIDVAGTTFVRCTFDGFFNSYYSGYSYGIYFNNDFDLVDLCVFKGFTANGSQICIDAYRDGDIRNSQFIDSHPIDTYSAVERYYYGYGMLVNCTMRNITTVGQYGGSITGFYSGFIYDSVVEDIHSEGSTYGFYYYDEIYNCTVRNITSESSVFSMNTGRDGLATRCLIENIDAYSSVEGLDCSYDVAISNITIRNVDCNGFTGMVTDLTIENSTIENINSRGQFYGFDDAILTFNCSIRDVMANSGRGFQGSYWDIGIIENCSLENVQMLETESNSDAAFYSDVVVNCSASNFTGGSVFYVIELYNSTSWNCRSDGIFMYDGDVRIENNSIVGLWRTALTFDDYVDSAVIKNNDIVGFNGYLIENEDPLDVKGFDLENNYFGITDTDVLNTTIIGSYKFNKTATTPYFPSSVTTVSGTTTWNTGPRDMRDVLIVTGDLSVSGIGLYGYVMVTGTLKLDNVTVPKMGLSIMQFEGSDLACANFTAAKDNGSKIWLQNDNAVVKDFDVRGTYSSITIYKGSNVRIFNGILEGYEREFTAIEIMSASRLQVKNLNISNYWYGIYADSDYERLTNSTIEDCLFLNDLRSIMFWGVRDVEVLRNTINSRDIWSISGIFITGLRVYVENNTVLDVGNPWYDYYTDVELWFSDGTFKNNYLDNPIAITMIGYMYGSSTNITVSGNTFKAKYYDQWNSWNNIELRTVNSLFDNNLCENTLFPIFNKNVITNNIFRNSTVGLNISTTDNLVINNTFYNQSNAGLWISTSFNTVYHNNFRKNFRHLVNQGTNVFQSTMDEGNYWDDYVGKDINGDGKGDTNLPHMNLDNYPYVYPDGWKLIPFDPVLDDPGTVDTDGDYTLTWSFANMASHYVLEEANNSAFTGAAQNNIPFFAVNQLPIVYKDFKDQDNGTYFYRIKGVNRNGESAWSNSVNITVGIPPQTPYIVQYNFLSTNGTVIIRWNEIASADNYIIMEAKNEQFHNSTSYNATASSYKFTGRDNGTYYYKVRAVSEDRYSLWSQFVVVSVVIPPGTPNVTLQQINTYGNYNLVWPAIPGATTYIVKEEGEVTLSFITTNNWYNFTGRPDGVYLYNVKANSVTGESLWSNNVFYKVDWMPQPPALEVSQVPAGNALHLTWSTKENDITNYTIECFLDDAWVVVADNVTDKYWTHKGLTDGVEYSYRIYARDQAGKRASAPTEPVKNTSKDTLAPPIPSIVNVGLFAEGGALKLSWQGVIADDLAGYNVYFSDNGIDYSEVEELNSTTFEYLKTNLTTGNFYYFYITTRDEVPNESPPSVKRSKLCDEDPDGDDVGNREDDDDDGDGIPDLEDLFPYDQWEWADNDMDGQGDNLDDDDDNDGYTDDMEKTIKTDPLDRNSKPKDTDGDFIPDELDEDIDNDGFNNSVDAFDYDPAAWADFDGDGKPDFLNGTSNTGLYTDEDADNDGLSNEKELQLGSNPYDTDSDGDSVADGLDAYPTDPDRSKAVDEDIVFTVMGLKVSKFDLLTTIISILSFFISLLFGYFLLTIKSRRFRRHRAFIQKLDDKMELYDYFMTVIMTDIEKDRLKPNDAVLIRHEYTLRLEQLGGGEEYEIYEAVAIAPEKKSKKSGRTQQQQAPPVEQPRAPAAPQQQPAPAPAAVQPDSEVDASDLEVQDAEELTIEPEELPRAPADIPSQADETSFTEEPPEVEGVETMSIEDVGEEVSDLDLDDDLFGDLLKDDDF